MQSSETKSKGEWDTWRWQASGMRQVHIQMPVIQSLSREGRLYEEDMQRVRSRETFL